MARIMAVKRTRFRSSGTRQALATQANILFFAAFLGLSLGFGLGLLLRLGLGLLLRLGLRLLGLSLRRRGRPRTPLALLARLAVPECVDRAAGLLDLLAGGCRETVRGHGQLLGQLAGAEDLDVGAGVADQAALGEKLRGYVGSRIEALEVTDVDREGVRPVGPDRHRVLRVGAALLAQAHVDRGLASLESGAHLVRARTGLLSLDSAARVPALAGAHAAADALFGAPFLGGLEIGEVELLGGHGLLHFLDADEVADFSEHTGELRALRVLRARADPAQPERPQGAAIAPVLAYRAARLGDPQLHSCSPSSGCSPVTAAGSASGSGSSSTARAGTGRISETVFPRIRATSSGRRSRRSPSTVAFAMLIGLVVPRLFARMSRTPASSRIARTPPPAITPVPSLAGRSRTRAASDRPMISCVMVVPCLGTVNRFFFASSTALEMASGTSRALPYPTPTRSTSSPITTSAVNEKRRPPLTTFATRLISTTRSLSSRVSSYRAVLKTSSLLRAPPRRGPSRVRGRDSPPGRTRTSRSGPSSRRRRDACRPRAPARTSSP